MRYLGPAIAINLLVTLALWSVVRLFQVDFLAGLNLLKMLLIVMIMLNYG